MLAGMKLSTTASNPVIFGRKSPVVFHFSGNHVRPTFRRVNVSGFKEADSITNTGFRRFSSIQFNRRQNLSGELGFCGKGLRILGDNGFRVASTSSGGGSGINGGYGGSDSGGSGGSDGGGGGSGGGGGGKKWTFVSWYLSLLEAYPVWTKAVTSALLTFVVIDKAPSVDLKRVSLFTFLGLVLVGPTLHFWYLYLSKLVTMTGASGAFLRLIVDQFLFAPAFIGVFLSTSGCLLLLQIGSCGYLSNFSTSDSFPNNFRFKLLDLSHRGRILCNNMPPGVPICCGFPFLGVITNLASCTLSLQVSSPSGINRLISFVVFVFKLSCYTHLPVNDPYKISTSINTYVVFRHI
ncbi:Mpv17/PMP22 [Cynara cardunculus var. scolymus]|uniref:Mpv17/PMP22 n=1 Tax=Cynara cardunculus var. scolymus TaxID=59895 RepID=A0A103YE71_CYNCS|nr:Mpv17/PMP22 [Cynara cardunculus var. scolymus]